MHEPVYRYWYIKYAVQGDAEFGDGREPSGEAHDVAEDPKRDYPGRQGNVTTTPQYDTDYELVEGCMMRSMFKRPVKLFAGKRYKAIRYMQLRVDEPRAGPAAPLAFDIEDRIAWPSYQTAIRHGWSDISSPNFKIMKDRTVAVRDGPAGQTDLLIGSVGFSSGVHRWTFYWDENFYGMHPVIGVGSHHAKTRTSGFMPLVGLDGESYGWHLKQRCLVHNVLASPRERLPAYPGAQHVRRLERRGSLNKVTMILDMDRGTLGFIAHETLYLGHAFAGLKGRKLYPMASTTFNGALIKLHYQGSYQSEPDSLMKQALHKVPAARRRQLEDTYDLPSKYYRSKPTADD